MDYERGAGVGCGVVKYGSVCSGVEAATVAWHPLGWEPQWFSEIEKFPSAVLEHHYPDVPNHGCAASGNVQQRRPTPDAARV